jgi:glycosyltransferase involved in cell wall biosynthesis
MRVALISHDIFSGSGQGRVNLELARHLLAEDVAVDLFAERIDPSIVGAGATWVRVEAGGDQGPNLARVWRFKRRATRLLRERADRYDVTVACGVSVDGPHTVNVAHFVHGTWVASPLHPGRVLRGPKGWYHRLYGHLNARWEQALIESAGTLVAVSETVGRDLVRLGADENRVHVIPNGVDLDEFAPGPADRARFGLPRETPLALYVGDLQSPIKNVGTALEALARVPGLHLALAGRAAGSPYPQMAEALGVADRTHFLGFQTDVAGLMRSADFFVLPSHQDAFGLVVTEAMACGRPVVVSAAVGASCLVPPAAGVVVDAPGDVGGFADAFERLAGSPAARDRMGRAARTAALDHSWTRMGERYLALFRRLAASPTAPAFGPASSPAVPSSHV